MSKNRGGSRTNNKKRNITAVSISIGVIVLLFLASLLVNSGFLRRHVTALEIDGSKLTSAQYQYFYIGAVNEYANEIYSNYSSYASSFLPDNSIPLSDQTNPLTGQTWDVFYEERTLEKIKAFTGAYKEAKAADFTVSDDKYAEVDEQLETMKQQIKEYNNMSLSRYFKNRYGSNSGVNIAFYREMSYQELYVSLYAQSVKDALVYTQDEIDTKYAENKDNYDYYKYRYFTIKAETPNKDDFESTEEYDLAFAEAVDAARELASGYVTSITDEQSFIDAAREYNETSYSEDSSTLSVTQGSSLSATYTDWLKDSARRAGDICTEPVSTDEETNEQFNVVFFVERFDNDYPTVNVQLLSVTASSISTSDYTDESGTIDEEAYNAAVDASREAIKLEAEEIYEDWMANGGTKEYLADLVNNHSHEEESEFAHSIDGGEYNNVYRSHSDDDEFETWLHDSARKAGDTTIFEVREGTWYLLYFAGVDMNYDDFLAETDLRNDEFAAWENVFLSKEAVFKWGMRLI